MIFWNFSVIRPGATTAASGFNGWTLDIWAEGAIDNLNITPVGENRVEFVLLGSLGGFKGNMIRIFRFVDFAKCDIMCTSFKKWTEGAIRGN